MSEYWLEDHPPEVVQYRVERRASTVTAIVVHTFEADWTAQRGAEFIQKRPGHGSYHSTHDPTSTVKICRPEWEAFHEGTGGNRYSLGQSFMIKADNWPELGCRQPIEWFDERHPDLAAMLRQGANQAHEWRQWVNNTYGVDIPTELIGPVGYRNGEAGFIGHGHLDPTRRHDPGQWFPWLGYLALVDDQEIPPMTTPLPTVPTIAIDLELEVQSLYAHYTPDDVGEVDYIQLAADIKAWVDHLLPKAYAGEYMGPHLAYIEWALRTGETA